MAQRRPRAPNAENSTNRQADRPFNRLSHADLEFLQRRLTVAAEEIFPPSELIGKTPQQDFYFRELLERLLINFVELQMPLSGGNYDEIWSLTHALTPAWRTQKAAKKGRAGYDRNSIKTLAQEWKRAFASRPRLHNERGVIEFALRIPDGESNDIVLSATFKNFLLVDGNSFSLDVAELAPETRLGGTKVDLLTSDDDRNRMLGRAARIIRSVETSYIDRLRNMPIETLAKEVEKLEHDKRRRDYLRIAAAILVVVGSALASYRLLRVEHFAPTFNVSPGGHGEITNVVADSRGRLALAKDGRPISQWTDAIRDKNGNQITVVDGESGSVSLFAREMQFESKIPKAWRADGTEILAPDGTCFQAEGGRGAAGALVICSLLHDLRSISPSISGRDVTYASEFGDIPTTVHVVTRKDVECLNAECSRVRLWFLHGYERNGEYRFTVIVFEDPDGWKNGTRFHAMELARLTVNHGALVGVEPLYGAKLSLVDVYSKFRVPRIPSR